jgi:hypothetical protein
MTKKKTIMQNNASNAKNNKNVPKIVNKFDILNESDSDNDDVSTHNVNMETQNTEQPIQHKMQYQPLNGRKGNYMNGNSNGNYQSRQYMKDTKNINIHKISNKNYDDSNYFYDDNHNSVTQSNTVAHKTNMFEYNENKNRKSTNTESEDDSADENNELENNELENNGSENNGKYVPPSLNDDFIAFGRKRERKYEIEELEYYDPIKTHYGDDVKLSSTWTVWIHENSNCDWSIESYKSIFTIDSVGSMWRFLSIFDNLDKNVRHYYIMRDGITPIWEDNRNINGAICSIMIDNVTKNRSFKGDLGVDAFIAICILTMNESFVKNNSEINGLSYAIKGRSPFIKIWIDNYEKNKDFINKLPMSLLNTINTIITNSDGKMNKLRQNSKSRISVQFKPLSQ